MSVEIRRSEYVCWLCLDHEEDATEALETLREGDLETDPNGSVYSDAAEFGKHLRRVHGV